MKPTPQSMFVSAVLALIAPAGRCAQPAWPMHELNNQYLIANSLNAADVNGDGHLDYAVIDESVGTQTILFHPGSGGDVRKPWLRVDLGRTGNPEYSCFGDVDGDGNIDFIVVEGDDLEAGLTTGVRVWWGPEKSRSQEPAAWKNAGHIPSTVGFQFLYCETHDMDGDGAKDILVGGRRHSITKRYAGLRWLKAPAQSAARRDLSRWKSYFIDETTPSGHGFVMADIDQDGDQDIVDATADWDTPDWDEELLWYENPGAGSSAVTRPWRRHRVWRSPQFYAKPQVGVGDFNGDGLTDLVTQTQNYFHFFQKREKSARGAQPWTHIEVRKPGMFQWIGRPVKFADLNGDGRLDVIAALIHNDGHLPKDKASVFWLENTGDRPTAWPFHVIKMSDGANTYHQWVGEKWDHLTPRDVDGDGDLDIVGNVEEHYRPVNGRDESWFSVVWFENTSK